MGGNWILSNSLNLNLRKLKPGNMPLIGSSIRGFGQMTVPRPTNMRAERETDRDREMEGYPILSVSRCFHHLNLGLLCSHWD